MPIGLFYYKFSKLMPQESADKVNENWITMMIIMIKKWNIYIKTELKRKKVIKK